MKKLKIISLILIISITLLGCEFTSDDYSIICDGNDENCNEYDYDYDDTTINNGNGGNNYNYEYNYEDYGTGKWIYHDKNFVELSNYYSNPLAFAEYAPDNYIQGLPLIVWLHGMDEAESVGGAVSEFLNSGLLEVVNNWGNTGLSNIPAIMIAPRSIETNWGYTTQYYKSIEAMIKYAKDKYGIDENRVVLMGHSMGGAGVIRIANSLSNENYFSALVPMSSNFSDYDEGFNLEYFKKIAIRGYVENDGYNHTEPMKNFFEKTEHSLNDLTIYNVSHGSIPQTALTEDLNGNGVSDLIEWAFSQTRSLN